MGKRSGITLFQKNTYWNAESQWSKKKNLALLQIPINPDVANKIENLKMLQTQVFWKITDGPMCKSPRVAIGAGTLFNGYQMVI